MTITWYGQSCFKILNAGGGITIITDPFDKSIGLTPPRGTADIVTVSHQHSDHNNIDAVSGEPFVIDSPGEYEIKGIKISGISSWHDKKQGKEKGANTIYIMEIDKIRLVHMGDFGEGQLANEQAETLGRVDILMMPVAGPFIESSKETLKIIEQIEPSIIIPMHYKLAGLKFDFKTAEEFLKEMGINKPEPVDKLTIKNKDLIEGEMKVVVMKL